MEWLKLLLFVSMFVMMCDGCRYGLRKKRGAVNDDKTHKDANVEISNFFTTCMRRKAGKVFKSWRSVVDTVLRDTKWYSATDEQYCPEDSTTDPNAVDCWLNRFDKLLKLDSNLLPDAKECMKEYAEKHGLPFSSGSRRRKRGANVPFAGPSFSKCPVSSEGFGTCVQKKVENYESHYPSLKFYDQESVESFVLNHFTSCRIQTHTVRGREVYREICPGKDQIQRPLCLPGIFEEIFKRSSPVRLATGACVEKPGGPGGIGQWKPPPFSWPAERNAKPLKFNKVCVVTHDTGDESLYDGRSKTDCEEQDECVWDAGECYNKEVEGSMNKAGRKPNGASLFGVPRSNTFRALTFGPPKPPGCIQPPPFPKFCKFSRVQPFVTEPPVDIPYCVRIPCSLDTMTQGELDRDAKACGVQPGCYFDVELYELREGYGPGIYPGVPVCHFAIRNDVFQREAAKLVYNLGYWNPYFTKCTLETFWPEIEEEPEGCKLISLLQLFGTKPKMAGWSTITSRSCRLIGGCWRLSEGCFYPVGRDIIVKSFQRFRYDKHQMIYGRPKCQGFNPTTPYNFLKSYHQCLASGCTIDTSTAIQYYKHLFTLGNSMSVAEHWKYWQFVSNGEIGAHNLDKIGWKYDPTHTGGPIDDKELGSGPVIGRPSGGPKPSGSSNEPLFEVPSFGRRKKRGIPMPPLPPLPPGYKPEPKKPSNCGTGWKPYGGRPCPPPELPEYHRPAACLYIPLKVPRFRPLKGSLEGCCDINLCYLSKRDIRKMHSGPAYYMSEWSFFTPCSVSCGGGGERHRYRKCIAHDPSACHEETHQIESCGDDPCPYWGRWSAWTPCTAGGCGISSRKRKCLPEGEYCGTEDEESKSCPGFC